MSDWISLDELVHSHAPESKKSLWLADFLRSCKELEIPVYLEITTNSTPPHYHLCTVIYEEETLADYWTCQNKPNPETAEGRELTKKLGYAINPSLEERRQGIEEFYSARIATDRVLGEEFDELPKSLTLERILPHDLIPLASKVEHGYSYQESLIGLRISSYFDMRIQTKSTTLHVSSCDANEILSPSNSRLRKLYKTLLVNEDIRKLSGHSSGCDWQFLKSDNYLYALLCEMLAANLIHSKNSHISRILSRKSKKFKDCRALTNDDPAYNKHREYAKKLVNSI